MIRRAAVLGLVTVFIATILCAAICPGREGHAANHVCDKPDHSCCPKSTKDSIDSQCVDTHFVEVYKFDHLQLDWAAVTVNAIGAVAYNTVAEFFVMSEKFAID